MQFLKEPHMDFLVLYRQGLSDYQIGKETHYNHSTVAKWRRKRGLPPVPRKHWSKYGDQFRPLYEAGMRDYDIARAIGCDKGTVAWWRKKNSLPQNQRKDRLANGL